MIDNFLTA